MTLYSENDFFLLFPVTKLQHSHCYKFQKQVVLDIFNSAQTKYCIWANILLMERGEKIYCFKHS